MNRNPTSKEDKKEKFCKAGKITSLLRDIPLTLLSTVVIYFCFLTQKNV